ASRPASGGHATADTGGGSGTVAFADLSSTSPEVAGDEPETTEPAVEPLIPAAVFDSRDVNVTPPVTLRLNLPSLGEDDLAQAGVVETIVSASGEVEKVRLVSPPQSVHEAMILSAIKTWRFRPAMKDGQPVRYRHLIPISLPR
ncbi:MAG: energy transducer TonB, partial [Vicinamibacterales bacterium]